MKRVSKTRIIVSLLLIAVLLLSTGLAAITANAESGAEKAKHTHDIAIVFDNSGSMYTDSRWSQAIYAMEVFASMLDYDNDKLGIYPMEEIQIGKGGQTITERMDIASQEDVKNIEKIYSPEGADTILKPAYTAYDYLKSSDLEEKWLIILTDGAFTKDKDVSEEAEDKDAAWLKTKIEDNFLVDENISVQYLGFAEASSLQGDESKNFYAANASSAEALTNELVNICNKIFKRNVISNVSSDGKFSIDVSMNSIIAFAQGKGASIKSLKGPDGEVKAVMDTELDTPSEGTGFTEKYPEDYPAPTADVSGQSVTYDACPSGDYQLDFTGSNVQVFYEPSVYIKTVLTDSDGKEVDLEGDVMPGEYTVNYGLVDAVTGEDVTDSTLLSPVDLQANVVNGDGEPTPVESGGTIELVPDDEAKIQVEGTFLSDYHISNEDDSAGSGFKVNGDDVLGVNVKVQTYNSGKPWYKLSDRDNWQPILVEVTYLGEPLTKEQFEKAELTLTFTPEDKEMSYRVEPATDESAYYVYIGEDENGDPVDPVTGKYMVEADVTYNQVMTEKAFAKFTVSSVDGFWEWLLWLLILAGVILLIFVILNLPAWPAKMTCRITKPKQSAGAYPVQIGNNMTLIPFKYPLSCTAKKASKLKHKFGKKAKIHISGITVHRRVETFTIGAKTYARQNGFKDGKGKEFSGDITSGKTIKMTFNGAPPLECKIDIN